MRVLLSLILRKIYWTKYDSLSIERESRRSNELHRTKFVRISCGLNDAKSDTSVFDERSKNVERQRENVFEAATTNGVCVYARREKNG